MFNKGVLWSEFVRHVQQRLLAFCPEAPTIVEIGHGDGSFLASLGDRDPNGRFVGSCVMAPFQVASAICVPYWLCMYP